MEERTFNSVVFPAPVPPEIKTFRRACTAPNKRSSMGSVRVSFPRRSSPVRTSSLNRRMERWGPSTASGGMMAFTRELSGSLASTMGEESSIRRPTPETILSMT